MSAKEKTAAKPAPEPEAPAEPGPIAEPGAETPPAGPADLAALESAMLIARDEAGRTEARFAAALAAGGFTARRKKAARVNGQLYQAAGEKVVRLSTD